MTTPPAQPAVDAQGRAVLTGISSRAFEHPADRAALTALRAVPGFDQVIRVASGMLRERQYRLVHLSSSVRVGERQFPRLHQMLGEVVGVLDTERPELYVINDPYPNAYTLGVDRPFVAITSGLYDLMDDDEQRFVIGHEVGHAMSGHALYRSMLEHILNLIGSIGWIPASGLALRGLVAALSEWQRKSELSGDRAGLLASQDIDVSLRVHMKTAGGAHLDQIDAGAFLEQAREYESSGDLRDGVLKLLNTERTTHPFAVVRAAELRRWVDSGEYDAILAGTYPLRADDHEASFSDNARDAARAYKKRIDESTDPLVTTVRNIGSSVGTAADSFAEWFGRRARGTDTPAGDSGSEQPPARTGGDIFDWFSRRDQPSGDVPDEPTPDTSPDTSPDTAPDTAPDNDTPDGPPPAS